MSYSQRRVLEGKTPLYGSTARPVTSSQEPTATPDHHSQQQIKILDRKKPESGLIILWNLVAGPISLIMGGLIAWFSIDFEDTIFGIGLAIYGLYEIYTGLAAILSSKSNHNIYRRGSELVDARVTSKNIEKASSSWFSGSEKKHMIELEYHAYWPDRGREILRIKAQVKKRRYKNMDVGSHIKIRYANEAPMIALLEGESGFKQSAF